MVTCQEQDRTGEHHREDAEPGDERAGEEGRHEHAEHVPLDDEGGVADTVMVGDHGQRRRRHREDHHAVADRGAGERDDEGRLAHDLGERAGARRVRGHGRWRDLETAEERHRGKAEDDDGDVGAGEGGARAEKIARVVAEVRAGDGRDDASGEDERDGAALELGACDFRRGEAVELGEALVGADQEVAEIEQPEAPGQEREDGEAAAERAEQRAEHEPAPTPDPLHDQRRRNGGQRGAH